MYVSINFDGIVILYFSSDVNNYPPNDKLSVQVKKFKK